jgi:sterol desaturase/sphingolipid hydroxylase (fatty acid hydroxylase superfamily)
MRLFALEHSKAGYRADFVLYAGAVLLLAVFMLAVGPRARWLEMGGMVCVGLAGWTAIEYAFHRFLLHGLPPFSRWHEQHHRRPKALIGTPTIMTATLIVTLVFLPALFLADRWRACGLTLGVLMGYLAYSITHHAIHHWHAHSRWLKQRKHWHALHHAHLDQPGYYGVTSAFWDHVFSTTGPAAGSARR